ncbi:DUF6970 domain-containing protein [Hymenobacter actinosclerus]|uniref:DUF6970 domain-containing protein n=1 Tax=Hymenobacter actinosclerus TaxID=82805 RepID=A0A1H9ZQW6_9BACT|nr:hypothetical protein [Hymenobacter actinosclerus]SES84043.1 hypothetical protein SAMN04487998_0434 [Hymenobacter actinosclerus]
MNRFILLLLTAGLALSTAGCSVTDDEVLPTSGNCGGNFSLELIDQLKQKPKQTPAAEVTQYTYQGRTVYLVTGGSPGAYAYLFDNCGKVVCAAAGGLNGKGDGGCPDFAATATDPVLIWRDPR